MWNKSSLRVLVVLAGVCAAALVAKAVFHTSYYSSAQSAHVRVGLPQDWSHRHVIFSNPTSIQSLLAVQQDPRFLHQWLKHNAHQMSRVDAAAAESTAPEVQDREQDTEGSETADADETARI